MKYCTNCGAQIQDQDTVCPACGTEQKRNIYEQPQQQSQGQYPPAGYSQQPSYSFEPVLPQEYKPLSPFAYVGYSILFTLPLVGFICLLVFSFSNDNINRRNYARSYFVMLLIAIVVAIAVGVIMIVTGVSLMPYVSEFIEEFTA